MHGPRRRLRLALISLLSGMLITGLLIAPCPLLARWARLESRRFIHEPVHEEDTWGAWEIGFTSGWLDEEWTLFYPGSYKFAEPNNPTPPPKLEPLPHWVVTDFDDFGYLHSLSTVATGWPCRAMTYVAWDRSVKPGSRNARLPATGVSRGWHVRDFVIDGTSVPLVIPLRPIWLGLTADVACWSLVSAAVFIGIVQLRSAHRRRRGLCVVCAYNLRGTPNRCPECGCETRPFHARGRGAPAHGGSRAPHG